MTVSDAKVSPHLSALGQLLSVSSVRVKCAPDDTVGDLKKLIAAQTGSDHTKIILKKWYVQSTILSRSTDRMSTGTQFTRITSL